MSNDPLLSAEQLYKITGKKRAHCQHAWFKQQFGVDLPRTADRVIISPQLFEQLQAKRAGLAAAPAVADRPRIYSLKHA